MSIHYGTCALQVSIIIIIIVVIQTPPDAHAQ
jgi:hypothetical protein